MISAFPIQDDIFPGESGHGYVLRMAGSNLVGGLPAIKKMLGKSRFAVIGDEDVGALAQWFGADLVKLRLAIGATGIGRPDGELMLCGHHIARSYFVNRMHPRICAMCLEEREYCKSHWELSLVTACPVHGVPLQERCWLCDSSISWDRPALAVCKCGAALSTYPVTAEGTPLEVGLSSWVHQRLVGGEDNASRRQHSHSVLGQSHLLRLLNPLTLSGGFQMVYALGTAERCNGASVHEVHRKKSSIEAARKVLFQADATIQQMLSGEPVVFKRSGLSVIVNLLAESAKATCDAADRSLAHSLIHILLRQGGRSTWKSRHPQLSQLELFSS